VSASFKPNSKKIFKCANFVVLVGFKLNVDFSTPFITTKSLKYEEVTYALK
jgi:hypothetical protein